MSSSPEGPTAEADNGSVVADVDLKRGGSLSVLTQFLSAAKYACFGVFGLSVKCSFLICFIKVVLQRGRLQTIKKFPEPKSISLSSFMHQSRALHRSN